LALNPALLHQLLLLLLLLHQHLNWRCLVAAASPC
jgi:hypothetical protein